MKPFAIFTDSACDLSADTLRAWNVRQVALTFQEENGDRAYTEAEMPVERFYQNMRDGAVYKTSAANVANFLDAFSPALERGIDVLYLGFSSGLSNTVNAARMAAEELRERYPDRTVLVVDSLCASAGQGLLLYHAVQAQKNGASLVETAREVTEKLPRLCHWFTVDDLVYLKRGGRVSVAAAFFGGILNIKPVLHVDDEGHLINMEKVRGRKQAVGMLAQKYEELALDPEQGVYFISHGDCLQDAKSLEAMIAEKFGNTCACITNIGPVIGSHAGPGTLALFFLGRER